MTRKLQILTNNVHTAYSHELARLGHDFHTLNDSWDITRPRPENWKTVDMKSAEKCRFDLILVNHDWTLAADLILPVKAPMIFSVLADGSEGVFPKAIEERCQAVTFLGKEVSDRWKLENPLKKRVIELGIGEAFKVEDRSGPAFLTVGNKVGRRWDKGHCAYVTVAQFLPLMLVGPGNEGLPGAAGSVPYQRLLELYATCKVYFNPGPIVGISMAEAMMAGMPVVTFRTINLCDLIQDGVNGFVVDTVDGALLRLRQLEADPGLRMAMGAASRETAEARFGFERWRRDWDFLFESVLR